MRKEVILLALALVLLSGNVVANKAPLIHGLNDEVLICEASSLSIKFTVADLDGTTPTVGISPPSPFFTRVLSTNQPTTEVELFSNNLTKADANHIYSATVYATDGEFSDYKKIKIKVLEKNNPPQIAPTPPATVDISKVDSFQKQITATDQETPQQDLIYSISDDLDLLDLKIDNNGLITYTPSENHLGVHDVTVCVTDTGIDVDDKIGICGQGDLKQKTCQKFQLSVVDSNAPPTILIYNSSINTEKIPGTQKITFQIYKYDPDGITPETYWYVDSLLKQISNGRSSDTLVYSFGCNALGLHKVKAEIFDGLNRDVVEWPLDIVRVPCADGIAPIESIGGAICEQKWACSEWGLCQNAQQSAETGILDAKSYSELQQRCSARNWKDENCGYQIRSCNDLNNCNAIDKKPLEVLPCYFSLNPTCSDKIQNCHDDKCEVLTDCGGPCALCATCSDGLKNQGEEGVDCGGPCAESCVQRTEAQGEDRVVKLSMLAAILLALGFAVIQIYKIMRNKKVLDEQSKRNWEVAYE